MKQMALVVAILMTGVLGCASKADREGSKDDGAPSPPVAPRQRPQQPPRQQERPPQQPPREVVRRNVSVVPSEAAKPAGMYVYRLANIRGRKPPLVIVATEQEYDRWAREVNGKLDRLSKYGWSASPTPYAGPKLDKSLNVFSPEEYEKWLTAKRPVEEPEKPKPVPKFAELARQILDSGRITLATTHSEGPKDKANARQNIVDAAAGLKAQRSRYGTAPGGSVALDERMLNGMLELSKQYTFRVTEVAGGNHSQGSRHYAGIAFDVGTINGKKVSPSHPDYKAFMAAARKLGATQVLGPGYKDHDTHIAWPR